MAGGTDDAVVRVQSINGTWETIGVGTAAGRWAEGLVLSANTYGSDKASFTLRRDADYAHPDLFAFTPIEVEVGGVPVWSGRIAETPTKEGTDAAINVEAEGWQYHLDDDNYPYTYVQSRLSDWQDARGLANVGLSTMPQRMTVIAGDGKIVLGANNGTVWTASTGVGVVLDLGPNALAKRVVVNVQRTGGNVSTSMFVRGSTVPDPLSGGSQLDYVPNVGVTGISGATFFSGTIATGKRYVSVFLFNGAGYTATADDLLQINSIQVFADATYESGNASALHADTVIKDALTQATSQLSTDRSQIAAVSFAIPDLNFPNDPKTPREVIDAVNAFHNYITMVDVQKRLVFQPRPAAAKFEVGSWGGSVFADASASDGSDVYDQVRVTGVGPDGAPLIVLRTQTGSLPSRWGFHKTMILQIGAALTTTVANQLGDTFLAAHKTQPLRGSLSIFPGGARGVLSSEPVHPAELLLNVNQLIRLSHRIDPDTGAHGRDGTIASVTYTHATREAAVELDSDRRNFEALLSRYTAVAGSRVQSS